jgi:transcriptional regulator with XRE-family HTH domain
MQGGSQPNFWGQLIYQLRTERDMSQRELAATAKVNRSTLRRIEEGSSSGDIAMIESILAVLGHELEAMAQLTGNASRVKLMTGPPPLPLDRSKLAAHRLAGLSIRTIIDIYA